MTANLVSFSVNYLDIIISQIKKDYKKIFIVRTKGKKKNPYIIR